VRPRLKPRSNTFCRSLFKTAKTEEEGHMVAFYVLAIDGKIVHLKPVIPEW